MKPAKGVLFLGHDATRTGAPLLLLGIIKWLKAHSAITPAVLLKRGGELALEYGAIAPTRCLAEEHEKLNGGLPRRVLRKLKLSSFRHVDLARLYPVAEFPVVYANTIDCTDIALQLAGSGRRIIHHIHELAYTTEYFNAVSQLQAAVPRTFAYIAASRAVREYLEKCIGVPSAKIHVIHEFPIAAGQAEDIVENKAAIRKRLQIPEGAFVVGMCGWPQWRKGTDLFVQLALHVKRLQGTDQCHFVWLGGDAASQREAAHDVTQLGLQDSCHFIPAVADPEAYFSTFNLFALTSREDPFSVAMLEAAAAGVPIICFANAGGAPELVEKDAGIIVPYLDVPAMAKACAELLADEKRRLRMGKIACAKVQERYTLSRQGPKIFAVINTALADSGNSPMSALKP